MPDAPACEPSPGPAPGSVVGARGEPFTLDVERGKLREFARATHAPADPYLTSETPPIPPTFLATARFWEGDRPWSQLGLAAGRVLHAEQEYTFPGPPPRAGDRLVGESVIEDVYVKDGRRGRLRFAVMVTAFRDPEGRLVARARRTAVEIPPPAAAPAGSSPAVRSSAAPAGSAPAARSSAAPAGSARAAWSSAAPAGSAPAPPRAAPAPAPLVVGPVTVTDFVRYQGASGDMNPLHHDPEAARAAGFPAPISVGMFQAGLLASFAVRWLGADRIRRFRVRFTEPVVPGDVLTCAGELDPEADAHGGAGGVAGGVAIRLSCTRQTGGVAATAWATFALD